MAWQITHILSYLVHPEKKVEEQTDIVGTSIPLKGKLYQMLDEVYQKSEDECNLEISFESDAQKNEIRDEIISVIRKGDKDENCGLELAKKLQQVTTRRSGLGLLFIIIGKQDDEHKILISRFPADIGILAEENRKSLRVEFLEKVFMKSAHAYKAVFYKGSSSDNDFWSGWAIDKQVNNSSITISNYWIKDFLLSGFKTTSAQGTKRLAMALKNSISTIQDINKKDQIISAVKLVPTLDNKSISINSFISKFGLDDVGDVIRKQLQKTSLGNDKFQFSVDIFEKYLPYQTVELDNGAIMTAPTDIFDNCFINEVLENGEEHYETQGRVISKRLRKVK